MGAVLGQDIDIERLARWDAESPISPETYGRLARHPRFAKAARALAANMLAAASRDRSLDGIFKDAGRYVAAMLALYLQVSGGLTLPRLKAVSAASGLLSPGRARAVLIHLRYLGYVEFFPARRAGMPARYLPTARFTTAWRAHLLAALEAASIIEPAVERVMRQFSEPGVFSAFGRIHCEGLMEATRAGRQSPTFMRVFMHGHAGWQILASLLTVGEGDVFPSKAPAPFSLAATARRFAVSRAHVRRLMDEAELAGLLEYRDGAAVVIGEPGRSEMESYYAVQLLQLLVAASRTIAERPELARSDWRIALA